MPHLRSIAYLVILYFSCFPYPAAQEYEAHGHTEYVIDSMQLSRNENSSPPESILPSSPAIATEFGLDDVAILLKAKAVLSTLGYHVGRFDMVKTARFTAAIFRFQKAHNLQQTGKLNAATLEKLGLEKK